MNIMVNFYFMLLDPFYKGRGVSEKHNLGLANVMNDRQHRKAILC